MLYAKKDHERLYHGSYKRKKGKRTKGKRTKVGE
jgi:hypothetical protein